MFAVLGEAIFDNVKGFKNLSRKNKTAFAQHDLINTKPRLQHTGEDLEELSFDAYFHVEFCNPKTEIDRLQTYRKNANVLALVIGNGEFYGYYVITDLSHSPEFADVNGNIFSATVSVSLKEHASPDTLGTMQQAAVDAAFALTQNNPTAIASVPTELVPTPGELPVPPSLPAEVPNTLPLQALADTIKEAEAQGRQVMSDIERALNIPQYRSYLLDIVGTRLNAVNSNLESVIGLVTDNPIVHGASSIISTAGAVQDVVNEMLPFIPLYDMDSLKLKSAELETSLNNFQTGCSAQTSFFATRFYDAVYSL